MKKLFITHSYFLHFDPKQEKLGQPYPPLGTLYAASVLRNMGHDVFFYDVMFDHDLSRFKQALQNDTPDILVIYDDGFNYLTKMCLTNMRDAAYEMLSTAAANNIITIISSSDSTDHYEEYVGKGADYVLLGEAEETLNELVQILAENKNPTKETYGLVWKDEEGKLHKNERRPVIRDLDHLPFPAWDLLDVAPYKNIWLRHNGYFSINMGTTRGCPYKCNWCAKPIYGNRYHARSPQKVVDEIHWLQQHFGVSHFWFSDDIFGLKPQWVQDFADILEKHQIKIRYKIQSRADLLLEENYIENLARSGCVSVWMGAESGSQRILDAMDKGITVDEIKRATLLLKRHDIKPSFFIQFGYLNEEWQDIKKTIDLINDMLPEDIGVSVSYPLPGTKFYDKVKQDLTSKSNWTDSDDLDLMFKNTYSPEFYKILHRYVHKNYRKYQAADAIKNLFSQTRHKTPFGLKRLIAFPYYSFEAYRYKLKLQTLR